MTTDQAGNRALDMSVYCEGVTRSKGDIWHLAQNTQISYPQDSYDKVFHIEDGSFWFKHRNDCITALIRAFPPLNSGAVFDVGGGNGYVAHGIDAAGFDVVLVEPGIEGARNARQRGLKNVICASLDATHFKRDALPAIGLFDVIEHVEADEDFLKLAYSRLASRGRLYLTTPAYQFLWSGDDIVAGHFRRYNIQQINQCIRSAGFSIDYSGYFFRPLPLPILLFRKIPWMFGLGGRRTSEKKISRDHAVEGGMLVETLKRMLKHEISNISRHKTMRFGASCIIAASRLN